MHDVIYFTLLRIPTAATVSGYVRCAHVALAIPLSMLAYLPQTGSRRRRGQPGGRDALAVADGGRD